MRRFLSLLMTCSVLLCGMAFPARADVSYDYLDGDGHLSGAMIAEANVIGEGWDTASTTLTGWYAVKNTLTVSHTLRVAGEAHLILVDGASLSVSGSFYEAAIEVSAGNSLTLYAQSTGSGKGALSAVAGINSAAIGGSTGGSNGSPGQTCGTITINGGAITATSDDVGIGGGDGRDGVMSGLDGGAGGGGGTITINGGVVTATSLYGAAIGGGAGGMSSFDDDNARGGDGGYGGVITISGGIVTATSRYGAGIGGGEGGHSLLGGSTEGGGGDGGAVTISGGAVTVSSAYAGSIGGGNGNPFDSSNGGGSGGTVKISGGTVVAVDTDVMNGNIGFGGARGSAGTVEISGGHVTGTLAGGWYSAGGAVKISGGRVISEGISNGLYGYDGGSVVISGGTVTVGANGMANGWGDGTTGGSVTISGGSVNASGAFGSTPRNGGENGNLEVALARTQLEGVSVETAVPHLTVQNAAYYGTNDLVTDASGILYLYLPGGAAVTGAETADRSFTGSVSSGTAGLLSEPSTDSALSGLTLSEGMLDPSFTSGTTTYSATVTYSVGAITVTPTASDADNATLTVNGVAVASGSATGEIPLSVGDNTIEVICTAEDSSKTTYTVTVTRQTKPLSADSTLTWLTLSEGTLDPSFASGTTTYSATVPYNIDGITVTPTVSDADKATLKVNGVAASSGIETGEIPLLVGDNLIEVTCMAEDGVHSTTYAITVTRSGAPVISVQPSDRTVTEGQRATFTVEAVGSGTLSYQWYVDRDGVKGWEAIDSPSARTATFTTSKAKLKSSGYRYACLIENQAGSVRSEPVALTVIEKSTPQTGDGGNLPLWLWMMAISGLGLLALLIARHSLNRR